VGGEEGGTDDEDSPGARKAAPLKAKRPVGRPRKSAGGFKRAIFSNCAHTLIVQRHKQLHGRLLLAC
jgi:hypothetical protein